MNQITNKPQTNMLFKAVKNFFSRMLKSQDEYPVKYYKRDRQYSKIR